MLDRSGRAIQARSMKSSPRIDRKLFLTFSLTSTAAWALGCSSDPAASSPYGTAGQGGASAGTGGSAAGAHSVAAGGSGTAGAAGSSAGSAGASAGAGGSAAGAGGASGGAAGSAGASAGAAGAPVAPNCNTQLQTFIKGNHGHVFNVSAADVMAGVAKAYDTKGESMHTHWIQLTAADFTKLANGGTVRKLSCNDGHEHEYIVNCVGVSMPTTTDGNTLHDHCDAGHKCADMNNDFCPEIP